MQHIFESWEKFSPEILDAAHILLFSDYDGTLTPIVSRPQDALLSDVMRTKLRWLANHPDFSLGIISGRSLSEIKEMVKIERIYYVGNHGLEIDGPGFSYINPQARGAQAKMKDIARQLIQAVEDISGVIIEDKGLSLSVHYRLVEEIYVQQVVDIFHQLTFNEVNNGSIRISRGKKVLEIKPPVDWHKGNAVETIIEEREKIINNKEKTILYLGDDLTDEDAYKSIRQHHGWSIFIGPADSTSEAEYFLESVQEVESFLTRLIELKQRLKA